MQNWKNKSNKIYSYHPSNNSSYEKILLSKYHDDLKSKSN